MHGKAQMANSLNWLDCRWEFSVQGINAFPELVRLTAGSLVGSYYFMQEADVGLRWQQHLMPQGAHQGPAGN